MSEDFDDLVTDARRDRDSDRDHAAEVRSQAEENFVRVVAEVERIGQDAARHLTEGGAPTVPVIEFVPALLSGLKVVEPGRGVGERPVRMQVTSSRLSTPRPG